MVRLLLEDDLPWLHELFGKNYPPPRYDAQTTERWFRGIACKDPLHLCALRTDDAFLVALMAVLPWLPGEPEVNVVCLCSDEDAAGWQTVRLLRASIEWARKRNAARWRITSDTGYDLRPLALRVGAREVNSRFQIDLRGGR